MSGFAPGDVLVRVSGDPTVMRIGTTLRLDDLWPCNHRELGGAYRGLIFHSHPGRTPVYCVCFHPENFRKIDKADEGFTEWMKTMRPKTRELVTHSSLPNASVFDGVGL